MIAVIRPWYRSRLFWFGTLGLAFLLWSWLANVRRDFHLSHTAFRGAPGEIKGWEFGSSYGSVYLSHLSKLERGFSGRSSPIGFRFLHETLEPDEPTIYFARHPFGTALDGGYREVWLAWWAAVLGYVVIWSGTLIGWQRRKMRKSKATS